MNNCTCCDQNSVHTNAYLNLNGIPYLVAEYLDQRSFQQIDSSIIKSEIFIDQSECMRTIVDISIDDIGKRASDGGLNIIGNATKQNDLITLIKNNYDMLEHQLPVFRKGIMLRVNYQLENKRTGQVLRSAIETIRIPERNYFMAINQSDINDNAIVVNFCDSMVSTIDQFTHGTEPMMLRITSIQMFYECVKNDPKTPRVKRSMISDPKMVEYFYGCESDIYNYHQQVQTRHSFDESFQRSFCPPTWTFFNRFYHYDEENKDMILHLEEINHKGTKTLAMACGTIHVNRTFLINPGHRIIFKFSIWKNDIIVVNDSSYIAEALKSPYYQTQGNTSCNCNPQNNQSGINKMDYEQNTVINQLNESIQTLVSVIKDLHPESGETVNPEIPELPEKPTKPPIKPNIPPSKAKFIKALLKKIDELQKEVEELKKFDDSIDEEISDSVTETLEEVIAPISHDWISEMLESLDEDTGDSFEE